MSAQTIAVWLAVAAACLAAGDARGEEPNLATNPGFERASSSSALPHGWWGEAAVYTRDATTARTGKASLKFVNADPKRYRLCAQRVALRAGRKYRFGVYVKTDGIAGPDSGASICLEWQDKRGQWMGGAYPAGVKGTRGWTRVEEVVRPPAGAAAFSLICYVRKGMTGTAWFDDVQVYQIIDPPMRTVLLRPVYRGRITGDVRVRVRLNLKAADLRLTADIRPAAGGEAMAKVEARPCASDLTLPVNLAKIAPGKYVLTVRLIGPAGKVLQTARHDLVRMPDGFKPKCTIDAHRRLLVDGKPVLPIGMYWHTINEKDIRVYADSKFNCLMPYGSPTADQMDLAHRHGLKVIYSVKDWYAGSGHCPKSIKTAADELPQLRKRVGQFRDHPALLAWYLNDELPQRYMPRLEAHQRCVAAEDPHHPTWVVLYQVRQVGAYINTFDVIGTDPYPIGRHPASMAAEWTAETFRQVERARPMWQVPQAHNWANYAKTPAEKKKGRTPTVRQERSMVWQCLCEGATGIIFYSWFDVKRNPDVPFETQWRDLKRIAAELDRMAPILLSVEPAPDVKVQSPRWLHWLSRSRGGKLFLFAANDGDGEGKVAFTVARRIKSVRAVGEDRAIAHDGNRFDDQLKKLDVRIYEVSF